MDLGFFIYGQAVVAKPHRFFNGIFNGDRQSFVRKFGKDLYVFFGVGNGVYLGKQNQAS